MKIARRDFTYDMHSKMNPPQFYAAANEEIMLETELCTGNWLGSVKDIWTPDKTTVINPTVCIGIEGARPGSMLAVKIIDIMPDEIGYTGFEETDNPLADRILSRNWGINTRTVSIKNGYVEWNGKVKLPVHPMIGTIGTAPASESLDNTKGGSHGGNMDVCEVCAGSTVYLPVFVPGALLHVGDVHAIQGDGEINNAGGIECRATVRLSADILPKPPGMKWIRMENDRYIMTVACCRSVEESFHAACGEMLKWMTDGYGFAADDAYLLMGLVLEARCTQFVNPTYSYICKMPKEYLQPS